MAKEKVETPKETNDKILESFIKDIEKTYGQGSVMKLDDKPAANLDVIPTGSLLLDNALGVGGYPVGRIIEIYGPESAGKSTLALAAAAECQKLGKRVAYVDSEHSINPVYAKMMGVNLKDVILSQPDYGEQALDIVEKMANSGLFGLIIVDSVAALVPKAELDGEMGDQNIGLHARLMSRAMRKLTPAFSRGNCVGIFVNQIREKVGVMYGNPEVTTGGKALKFFSTIRVEVRRGDYIKKGADTIGNAVKVKIVKNKVAPPFKSCEFDIIYGQGIDKYGEVVELAIKRGVIQKSGSWLSYNGEKLCQGSANAVTLAKSDENFYNELVEKIAKAPVIDDETGEVLMDDGTPSEE